MQHKGIMYHACHGTHFLYILSQHIHTVHTYGIRTLPVYACIEQFLHKSTMCTYQSLRICTAIHTSMEACFLNRTPALCLGTCLSKGVNFGVEDLLQAGGRILIPPRVGQFGLLCAVSCNEHNMILHVHLDMISQGITCM